MQQTELCSGQLRAQRARWRSGWRWLVALLLMMGAVAPTWATCTSPINFTVASGATYTFTCDPIGFSSVGMTSPAHGQVVFNGDPTHSNYLEYVNDGTGTTDTFIVVDSSGTSITFNATITGSVSPITVSPATLSTPTVGVAYSQTLTASGGNGTYSYSITSGSLPPGLSLSSSGVISGTSTGSGYYAFTVHVVDSTTPTAQTSDKSYAFTIANPTLTISPSSPPTGIVGQPYSVQFSTSGGTSPYTYSTGSALPAGLTLSSGGLLSGTPSTAASTTISLQSVSSTSISSGGHVSTTQSVTLNMAVATVPGAPTIGTATAGNTQAVVAFTAPASDGGAAITGYTATSSPGGLTGSCTSSPCTVTGLTNGTPYTFTVTATNSVGTGSASAASNSVTPKAPQTVTFTNPGAQSFGTAPMLSATASSGLTVAFSSTTTGVCTVTSVGALTFLTTGTCSIDANQAGGAAFLAAPTVSQSFTVNAVVPGAPTIGTATAGDAQASVAFTAPASNGGATITGYTATSSPSGLTGTCASSPCTVAGLTDGLNYTFTVTATNSAGTGSASAASNSITPKAAQTITFSNPGAQNFGTTPVLSATASSGLTVSFSSTTTGVCTVTSGGALTFVAAGTCSINADQAGDGSHLAASTVSQSFTVNAVVPGAPTIGTATAGDTQATVSFTAPASSGGANITGYTVTSSPGGFTGTGASGPITVSGLTNGTPYTFTVTATNSAGTGSASAASNSVTPKAPQTITFTNPGAQSFGTAPMLSATASSGLTVAFSSTTTGVCTVTSVGALTFLSSGTCSINADQAGDGSHLAASTVSQSFTVNSVVPGAPTIGTATAGDTQATVSFTAPASSGGANITGYTVTSSPGGFTGTGASGPITVSGLTNGTPYTFTVTATNSAGTGSASAASNSVTPKAPQTITFSNPGAQNFGTTPTLTATSNSSLTVSFSSTTTGVCTVTSGGALTFLSTGTCSIDANQAGDSSYLAASTVSRSFSVNAVVPGAPTIGTATAGDVQATVTFTAPTSDGGSSITGYTVTASPGGITAGGTSSPITVTGLTNGQAYSFTVTASNAAGTGTASALSNSVTPTQPAITVTPTTSTAATVGLAYNQSESASGGTAPYTYSVSAGALPAGLSLSSSGIISGTPTAGGTFNFTVKATDSTSTGSGPYSGVRAYALTVNAPTVTVSPGTLANGSRSSSYSTSITASGGTAPYAYAVSAGALPAGLTLSSGGTLSGTPTAAGTFNFTVSATDSSTGTGPYLGSQAYTLSVSDLLPVAQAVSATVAYDSTSNPVTLSFSGGAVNSVAIATAASHGTATASGTSITYTPTAGYAGSDSFTYTGTNATGTSAAATVTITVSNPTLAIAASGALTAQVGQTYSQTFTFSGGSAPYTGLSVSGLPAGLTVTASDTTSVTVSGTPTASGTFALTVAGTDASTGSGPFNASQVFSLGVASASISLTPASLPGGTVAGAYSQTLSANGGTAPYSYAVSAGALPAGLTLSSSGTISGTPTASGSFAFTVQATDSSTGTGSPAIGSAHYTIQIAAPTMALTPSSLPGATQGAAYSQALSASGGTAPYAYAVTSGALPAGISLTSGGALSGTPTAAGSYQFTVTATDSSTGTGPFTASQALALTVTADPPITANDSASTPAQQAVTIPVTANDSGSINTIAVTQAPTHGTASVNGLSVLYTPTGTFFGTDTFTYTATGPGGTSQPATVTVTVTALAPPTAGALTATVLAGKSVTLDATQGASGGPFTSAQVVTAPSTGTVTVSGTQLVYHAPTDASGAINFTYTLSNAYGSSQPATATVQVNALPRPVPLRADAVAGQTVHVDLTGPASGGPFTAATLVSIAPSNAGSGSIVQSGSGYRLDFTPAAEFGGTAQVAFTLSNAYATSAPAMVSIQVTLRPDPSKDSEVTGILQAQNEATRRFAVGQLDNFSRRLESLHAGGTAGFTNGLTFTSGGGWRTHDVLARNGNEASPGQFDRRYLRQPDDVHADPSGNSPTTAGTGVSFWTGGAVNFGTQKLGGSHNGVDFTTTGISVGADTKVSSSLAVGGGIGYGHDASDIGNLGSRSTANAYTAAAYASYHPGGALYLDGLLGYQSLSFDSRRHVTADGAIVDGSRGGHQSFGSLALTYEHRHDGLTLAPYGRLDLARATLDGYTEIGDAIYALRYDRQTVRTSTGSLGIRLSKVMQRDFGTIAPLLRLEYRHDFHGDSSATMRYADLPSGPLYRADLGQQTRNHTLLGLGLQAQTTRGLTLRIEYQSLFESSSSNNQSIQLGLECPFNP